MEISGRSVVGFLLVLGLATSDTRLARRKLGKKIHPDHGGRRRPSSHGRHGAPVPTLRHNKISQHTARQVCAFKSRIYFHY
jgi:hypothetical protein